MPTCPARRALFDVPQRSSPAPSCSDTPTLVPSSASSSTSTEPNRRQLLEKQLLELQGQQAYEQEQMRLQLQSRQSEIARLQYLMRNS